MGFFGQLNFSGLTASLLHPPKFSGLFPMDTLSNQIFQAFHLSGLMVPFLLHRTHIMFLFQFHVMKCNRGASVGHRPTLLSPPSNIKYSADIIPCTHTHVMRCSVHQCNTIVPLHFMSCPMYNDYYKDIIYRTLHRVPWTIYV